MQMTLQEYVERSNRVVAAYFTSPAFGENINMGEYPVLSKETMFSIMHPYSRGELLAWRWTTNSRSHQPIDITLLQMMKDAENKLPLYSDKLAAKYLAKAGVVDALADIENYLAREKKFLLLARNWVLVSQPRKFPCCVTILDLTFKKVNKMGKLLALNKMGRP